MLKLINRVRIQEVMYAIAQTKAARWLFRTARWLYMQVPSIAIYGYAFLYMYTGYDKLRNVETFIKGNSKIPLVGKYAELIGWGIPIIEILLAVLLILPQLKIKKIALYLSVILMGIFTIYIAIMLFFVPKKLCHCGGVIESMGWTTHLIFNLLWLGAGILVIRKNKIYKS